MLAPAIPPRSVLTPREFRFYFTMSTANKRSTGIPKMAQGVPPYWTRGCSDVLVANPSAWTAWVLWEHPAVINPGWSTLDRKPIPPRTPSHARLSGRAGHGRLRCHDGPLATGARRPGTGCTSGGYPRRASIAAHPHRRSGGHVYAYAVPIRAGWLRISSMAPRAARRIRTRTSGDGAPRARHGGGLFGWRQRQRLVAPTIAPASVVQLVEGEPIWLTGRPGAG